jgi:zinc carboxypeptidase
MTTVFGRNGGREDPMINVPAVIKDMPHFETFCSVEKLHGLVERLRADSRFEINAAGTSVNGLPIHHVRFGKGAVKSLFVAGPHAMEPIGSLTVFSLMSLLHEGNRVLLNADVEWHIVPCIDPDGAILNEGWSQKPFMLENFMRNYYVQAPRDQVDISFPITHKKLAFDQPSKEARILQGLLDRIRPDFYFSLHNAFVGGGFYYFTRDIGQKYYRQIHELLEQHHVPLQKKAIWREICAPFGEGIVEQFTMKKYYDQVEKTVPHPEEMFKNMGASSSDYLAEIKPSALTFVAEFGYVRHPDDESQKETGQNLRQFKLRIEADTKCLVTAILEEWERVKEDVDATSPFYKARFDWLVSAKEKICESGGRYGMRDTLFNPDYGRTMTESDRFQACMVDSGLEILCTHYQFVRLLKASKQTPAVRQATERLERAFAHALTDIIANHVDLDAFEVIDCDTLAKVQLGSGLIALDSVLETQRERL